MRLDCGGTQTARGLPVAQAVEGSTPSPHPKPDMAALREICAGDPCTLGIQDAMDDWPEPCTHIEYVEAEGEWYRCSLISGHKGKCQRGERV